MLRIDNWSQKRIKEIFPTHVVDMHAPNGSWQTSRYIQIFIDGCDKDLHYEYRIESRQQGRVELHFEGKWETKYHGLIEYLKKETRGDGELSWSDWRWGHRCQHSHIINSWSDLQQTLSYMVSLFDKLIASYSSVDAQTEPEKLPCNYALPVTQEVELFELKLGDILKLPLAIPNYQRIYCWEEEHVHCLLRDIFEHLGRGEKTPYRLGAIILHAHDGKYDIIDGQQRLVTLALLLSELGLKTSLLQEKFISPRSKEYIAYNKYLIREYVKQFLENNERLEQAKALLQYIELSVLVLQNTSLDLAYTFFSNHNSRGVALTDYDLLKAHHLRYLPAENEKDAEHAAEQWNSMVENTSNESNEISYVRVLDTYIYRMRKWMRKKDCNEGKNNYRIKREYEAAPTIEEIDLPGYVVEGSRYYFNDPIQGGQYFFSYVHHHIEQYSEFTETPQYKDLHKKMQGGSNQHYRDCIESLLFAYYSKFGNSYLSEALAVIMRIVLQHRYTNKRAMKASIVRHTRDSELIWMIDRATLPTFFLAEAMEAARALAIPGDMQPIMRGMQAIAFDIMKVLDSKVNIIQSFKSLNK